MFSFYPPPKFFIPFLIVKLLALPLKGVIPILQVISSFPFEFIKLQKKLQKRHAETE